MERESAGSGARAAVTPKSPTLDLYLCWALLTRYRYLAHGWEGPIRFVVQPLSNHDMSDVQDIPRVHVLPVNGSVSPEYFSVEVRKPREKTLAALARIAKFVLAEPSMRPAARQPLPPCAPVKRVGTWSVEACRQDVVIAVIDGSCGFANTAFCDRDRPTASLIDFFWDQGAEPRRSWRHPSGFSYGRELVRKDLDRALGHYLSEQEIERKGSRAVAERALYRRLRHALPFDADWSHGTHVLATVLADYFSQLQQPPSVEAKPGVIYVQLPDVALGDTSARWTTSYVLDAIRYVLHRAGDSAHVVINLSLGAFAGPHDGSSWLELAIDDLIESSQGKLSVVVAAGNAGRVVDDATGRVMHCRSRIELDAAGSARGSGAPNSVQIELDIDCEDTTETFLEIRLPVASGFDRSPRVTASLRRQRDPSNVAADTQVATAVPGHRATIESGGEVVAAVLNATGAFQAPNGNGGFVLVALGHSHDPGAHASMGRWIVEIANDSEWPIVVEAWLERRDVPGELEGVRPQYGLRVLEAKPGARRSPVEGDASSLGSLANGEKTIIVGAADRKDASQPYEMSDYSSMPEPLSPREKPGGATRRRPDMVAVGKRTSAGFLSGSEKDLAGTSMAAAQVTAALAASLAVSSASRRPREREGVLSALEKAAASRAPRGPKGSSGTRLESGDLFLPALPDT